MTFILGVRENKDSFLKWENRKAVFNFEGREIQLLHVFQMNKGSKSHSVPSRTNGSHKAKELLIYLKPKVTTHFSVPFIHVSIPVWILSKSNISIHSQHLS